MSSKKTNLNTLSWGSLSQKQLLAAGTRRFSRTIPNLETLNGLADTFRHHYVEINPLHLYPWREFLHTIVLIPSVASDVKNIILWSSRYPHFGESYGADVDYTSIPFSPLPPMSQKTFITAAQKANVSEAHEGLDVALRNDNLSAWVALVLSRMARIETLYSSISSEWPGIFPVGLFENTDSSILEGAPRFPVLRDVRVQQSDRRPPHLHGVELVSLFLRLPSPRTFCHNGPLGQHFTLNLE